MKIAYLKAVVSVTGLISAGHETDVFHIQEMGTSADELRSRINAKVISELRKHDDLEYTIETNMHVLISKMVIKADENSQSVEFEFEPIINDHLPFSEYSENQLDRFFLAGKSE